MPKVIEKTAGKIRNLPISRELRGILESAARECNLNVHVTSGGQPPAPATRRTGSTRHDVGGSRMGAADLQLIRPSGAMLDMRKAADQALMGRFTRICVTAGAVGVGAGLSYMGAHTIHIGGGTAATWGGTGSQLAPQWLRTEHAAGMLERRAR